MEEIMRWQRWWSEVRFVLWNKLKKFDVLSATARERQRIKSFVDGRSFVLINIKSCICLSSIVCSRREFLNACKYAQWCLVSDLRKLYFESHSLPVDCKDIPKTHYSNNIKVESQLKWLPCIKKLNSTRRDNSLLDCCIDSIIEA